MESNLKDKPTTMIKDSILTKKLKFEKLISVISSQFVGNYDLDIVINESLAKMGEFTNASRVFIFIFDTEKEYMKNTHEWCNKNIDSHINDYTHLSLQDFPWVINQFSKAKPIIINDISDLPSEAKKIKNLLMNQGVKSNLTIPLHIHGDIGGFIGFDDDLKPRNWLDEDLNLLQISSRIIGNALERKFSEEKLKESEENFREITEQSFMGICIIQDFCIKYINKTITKMLGYSEKEIKEWSMKEFLNVIHPEDRALAIKRLSHRQKRLIDEKLDTVYRIFTKNGEIKWMDIYSKIIQYKGKDAILATLIDVTERKKAEQKLKESEEKYRSILENINEGYFEVDLEGNFIFFNDALCKSSGYSREELLNKSYSRVFDEETKERVFRVYNDLYKKGEGFALIEYQILKKNGMRTYYESSVYLRSDPNGEIIGFKGFVRDISERKKAEALRKKFSQELEKEVELRTKELKVALDHQKLYLDQILKASHFKTEFLATMSHELRTPLNAIIGFTDLLLEEVYGQLNLGQLEFIKDIEESSKHLLDMISNILDISKIESGQVSVKIDNIQLYDLVNQVISTLKSLYSKKDLKIELKDVKKKQIILADRLKFKQIIYNLLSNAIKFTEKGTVTFEFLDKKDNWEFNVKDTGIGIAKEDFNMIFKDFKRVKSPYVDSMLGSGLGLSLTKRIIQLHGGDISFTSKLGKGSTFIFNIPKKNKDLKRTLRVKQLLNYL